jgi:hypothetical protein
MDLSQFREKMRRRAAEQAAEPPLTTVREMLGGFFADAENLDEVERLFRSIAATTDVGIRQDLTALEAVLADPSLHDQLGALVEWYASWGLDDPSDEGARRFLESVAEMMRDVIGRRPR